MERGEPGVNESASDRPVGRPLELAQWVDEVCEHFEAAWQSGGRPRLEDYLGGAAEPQRTELLHELILLEFEYSRRRGGRRQARMTHLEVGVRYPQSRLTKTHYVRFGNTYVRHPRSFVLSATLEWLRLPKDLAAYVIGKSLFQKGVFCV
jgi:hypothetical protein